MNDWTYLRSLDPADERRYPADEPRFVADDGQTLLDVAYDWDRAHAALGFDRDPGVFARRLASGAAGTRVGATPEQRLDASGVWRFRELLPFWSDPAAVATVGEGRTTLQRADELAGRLGFDGPVYLQYEGMNPSGSFKDNGMAAAFTHARAIGADRVVCASTGNTSASLGLFAARTGLRGFVLVGSGRIAFGKLSQALDFGATTLQVAGDFDACLARVREIAVDRPELGVYLMNSLNAFRLEGQKAVMYRVLEGLGWEPPDWILCPGGNLGNCSAFGKAFLELRELGMIDRTPRLAVINARGARTLDRLYNELGVRWNGGAWDRERVRAEYERMDAARERARTVASAIEINRPVNLPKALRALDAMDGVVRTVDDPCILEHKALVGRCGFGCEPASAASVAGARRLREEGVIGKSETVVCVLTGHQLKDPDATVRYHAGGLAGGASGSGEGGAGRGGEGVELSVPVGAVSNRPVRVADDVEAILAAMGVG